MVHELRVKTSQRSEFVEITHGIEVLLQEVGAGDGVCTVFVPHTTAAVTVNENADPTVVKDILRHLEQLVPEQGDYWHLEGNSDAHIKAVLVGSSVTVPIQDGRLLLGRWQGVFLCEFDGPRERLVRVQITT